MLPEVVIGTSSASWDQVKHAGVNQNEQSTLHHDGHTNALYHLDDVLDIVIETQGAYSRSSHGTAKTSFGFTHGHRALGPPDGSSGVHKGLVVLAIAVSCESDASATPWSS